MRIIEPRVEFEDPINGEEILQKIERCGRVCYKSEDKITGESAENFVRSLIKRKHESVLEHCSFSIRFICDRGVTHELVRHRLASYSQESTRYCNYSKDGFNNEITVIKPCFWEEDSPQFKQWQEGQEHSEYSYFSLLNAGATPQEARSVLTNSLKTEIVMTANLREWRHFFQLRCAQAAHPQMRQIAKKALQMCKENIPVIFDDIIFD